MGNLKQTLKQFIPDSLLSATRPLRSHFDPQRRFDRKFKVTTCGLIEPAQLDFDHERRQESGWYQPTPQAAFARIMKSIRLEYERFVFVDMGSGSGAVLLYASDFPFKRIIGVEFSPRLHGIAERNIAIYRCKTMKCRDIQSVCFDAAVYPIPPDPTVFFLFNPFKGKVLERFVANVGRSLSQHLRDIVVIYYHTLSRHPAWDRVDFLRRTRQGQDHTIYTSLPGSDKPPCSAPTPSKRCRDFISYYKQNIVVIVAATSACAPV